MGSFSWVHLLILLAVVLLLFGGGGKIPKLMRDLGQGVTAFRKGLKSDKDDKGEDGETATATAPSASGVIQPPAAGSTGTISAAQVVVPPVAGEPKR